MNNKINELLLVVGKQVSENFSPTLRAKLISVDENRNVCLMEVAESPYKNGMGAKHTHKVGTLYEAPVYRIHNAFFF